MPISLFLTVKSDISHNSYSSLEMIFVVVKSGKLMYMSKLGHELNEKQWHGNIENECRTRTIDVLFLYEY